MSAGRVPGSPKGGLPAGTGLVLDTAGVGSVVAVGSGLAVAGGALTSAGWFNKHRALAATLAGINGDKLETWENGFQQSAFNYVTQVVSGGGSAAQSPNDGGSVLVATSTTTAGETILFQNGFVVTNCKTKRWYIASRSLIVTASDAQTEIYPVHLYDGGGNPQGLVVVNGQLLLRIASGGTTDVVTSWTVDTTVPHDFAVSFDLTTVTAWVDGVSVGTQTLLTNLSTSNGEWAARAKNGTTAAVRSVRVYAGLMGLEMP